MNKAVFLDRDGVINFDPGDYTFRQEDFKVLPYVGEALQDFSRKGYLLIVISNQAGIARGFYGHDEVQALHVVLTEYAQQHGVRIEEVYYCPHYTKTGRCLCRKPDSLLIEKALARFGIQADSSYFIGDKERDMQAAKQVGVHGILVEPNVGLQHIIALVK